MGTAGQLAGAAGLAPDRDGLALLQRLAQRTPTPEDLRVLSEVAAGVLRDQGEGPPIERRLRIPTAAEWRKAERDDWIRSAARALGRQPTPTARRRELFTAWQRFTAGALWDAWRDDGRPPEDASALHRALFHAHVLNDHEVLSEKQIGRVLDGQTSTEKCPPACETVSASQNSPP